MLELLILKAQDKKQTMLIENKKLIEYFDETNVEYRNEGNIFIGVVKDVLAGMESAFVDIGTDKNGYIHVTDLVPQTDEKKGKKNTTKVSINKIIKPNDKILVQVKKDSNDLKGARISTHINLPGKYIALMPNTDIITVSQKIDDAKEQERLIKLVKENISTNNGAVIRTSAKGKEKEIIEDLKKLEKTWEEINSEYNEYKKSKSNKPKIIFKCQDIACRMVVDLANKKKMKIISNDKYELEKMKKFLEEEKEFEKIPTEMKSVKEIEQIYNLEAQIEKVSKRKVWLKTGGFITIDKTEALTAIDVNTGKLTDGENFNDIVYKTNEQAAIEIAKQVRLRDIGGIIIIDFIDMLRDGDREKIEELLKECLKEDRAKTQVEGFTKLYLMEMTRKHICSHRA